MDPKVPPGVDDPGLRELERMSLARRHLPSELVHRPLLKWPADAEALTGIPDGLLRNRQAAGDAPLLVHIGRQLYVRPRDLHDWIDSHVAERYDGGERPVKVKAA